MARMNKHPTSSVKSELEKELMSDIIEQQHNVDAGRDIQSDTRQGHADLQKSSMFAIRQGIRRRHPDSVLHQFALMAEQTDPGRSSWEQAMVEENERIDMDQVYRDHNETEQTVTQLGLVQTALANYKKSTEKLSSLHASGV